MTDFFVIIADICALDSDDGRFYHKKTLDNLQIYNNYNKHNNSTFKRGSCNGRHIYSSQSQ